MRRVKVLHIITHLGVGGALDNTLLTVQGMPRDRYEVHLAAGALEAGYTSWEERSRRCADELFLFPDLRRPINPFRDARVCGQLAQFMRANGYEIVHTHCAKAGVVGRIAARRAGTPVVVHTCHAFASQVTRSHRGSLRQSAANRAKKLLFDSVERYACRISDRVITVCEQNRLEAIRQGLAPPDKIATIYSGIDLDRFNVQAKRTEVSKMLNFDPSRPLVAFIGRLAEQKAPLDFVAAAKRVLQQRRDAQFVIAGDGPLAGQVAAAIGDEPAIRCVGFYQHVPALLAATDVLGVSSLWEGLGRSVTEAMLAGVPVAATNVDGIPELVIHGQTGLLSPPRDPSALAENILRLIDRPEEAKAMARRARDRVGREFGADRMVKRIDEMYRHLMREKGILPADSDCPHRGLTEEAVTGVAT